MTVAIKVENLSKKYVIGAAQERQDTLRDWLVAAGRSLRRRPTAENEFWALRDVSFEVQRGEVVGVIGRNGAGKSTLLKILSRITEPTSGRAYINGRVGSLLEVGTGFHPELTGRENIFLNGAILGMRRTEIARKFDEIVAFAEIEKFLDTPVKRYSSGMYVRLAFAVAAHLEPEILLVDEVLAVGDAAFQKKCLGKMGDVAKEGRTVLFVSHNMAAVEGLCKRCIWIDNGTLAQSGTTKLIVESYFKSMRAKSEFRNGKYIVANRTNHFGEKVIVTEIDLKDLEDNLCNSVRMGEGLKISVRVEGLCKYRDAMLGIIIKNSKDMWVASFNTGMSVPSFGTRFENEIFELELHSLNFVPGQYSIDVSVAQAGVGRLDYAEHAAFFEILEGDVYGTGYRVTDYFGVVYLQGTWTVKKGE